MGGRTGEMMAGYWMGVLLHEIAYERTLKGHDMTMASEFLRSKDGFNLDADSEPVSSSVNQPRRHEHYFKDVSHLAEIDVYRVCDLYCDDRSGATQHAIKKLLLPGERGAGKSREKDYREAIDTLQRKLAMMREDAA